MRSRNKSGARGVVLCLALSAFTHSAFAASASAPDAAPADLSLEELLRIEVQTASRKAQRLQDVAAAAFVITREDIERSGATSLPEALRLAPGVQVARLANNRWAVSARGFNGRFANKLLVLMDGRSIYSPLFSGVLWEMEDTLLDDVDRIEVIRGPGAALWGANAVNGVINIITRHARDTRGTLAVAGAGSEERAFGALRHGFAVGEGSARLWAKGFSRDVSVDLSGQPGNDDWHAARAGYRADWNPSAERRLTVSGSIYNGPTGDRWNVPAITSSSGSTPTDVEQGGNGANLLLRHEWLPADGSASTLQAYVDRTHINVVGILSARRTTLDVDFQHRLAPRGTHDVIWGLSHRDSRDKIESGPLISILPDRQTYRLSSAFLHDEITLQPDRLKLSLGARLEHNNFTGLEPQPNARLIWTPTAHRALWGAVSRAVRTPSRAESDASLDLAVIPAGPMSPPVLLRNLANPDPYRVSERLIAIELGYRHRLDTQLSFDVALFHNRYTDLRGGRSAGHQLVLQPFPYVIQDATSSYDLTGETQGLEILADWQPASWWRVQGAYSLLHARVEAPTADPFSVNSALHSERSSPRHQLSLRTSMSLAQRQQIDLWLRRIGAIDSAVAVSPPVPAYTTLDVRYAWRGWQGFELSIVGQNLLDATHQEFIPDLLPSQPTRIQRGWYVKAKWQY